MARLAWQNVDAPNLAPAMQGFANVTTLLDKALASSKGTVEDQLKLRKYQDDVLKAQNDKNSVAAARELAFNTARLRDPALIQQGLADGSIFGSNREDLSPEAIQAASNQVALRLTDAENTYKVNAIPADRRIAQIAAIAPNAATFEAWRTDPKVYNDPSLQDASAEAWNKFGTRSQNLIDTSSKMRTEDDAIRATEINQAVDEVYGLALAGAGSNTDIRNNAYALAKKAGFTGPQLTELTNRLNKSGIAFADPVAQLATTTAGKTGSTPASAAISSAVTPIDNSSVDSSLNTQVLRRNYGNKSTPSNINTLGELSDNRTNNHFRDKDGVLHTATGPLQIIADTFARHGERVYGKDWRGQSLNDPTVHYKVGESIFKETGGNVDKLIGQFDGLKKLPRSTVEQIAKAPWSEAAPVIAAAENTDNAQAAARSMRRVSNPDYGNSQISNVTNKASRAIAQVSANPLVANYNALNNSKLTADQVALDGVKTSVDFGSLNKDEMDSAARNIKRTINYVQEQAGGNISAELAFAIAKKAYGNEWFRVPLVNDLDLATGQMSKIIKDLKSKGGIPDQANNLEKMNKVFTTLKAADDNVLALRNQLTEAQKNNAGNAYNTSVSKLQDALDRALDVRTKIAQQVEKNPVFQPKENVTVEQKLNNAAEERKTLADSVNKKRITLRDADEFIRTGKRQPTSQASTAIQQSLASTPGYFTVDQQEAAHWEKAKQGTLDAVTADRYVAELEDRLKDKKLDPIDERPQLLEQLRIFKQNQKNYYGRAE